MTLKADEIAALIELFAASSWTELHVEIAGLQLFLSTDPQARLVGSAAAAPAAVMPAQPAPALMAVAPAAAPPADAPQKTVIHPAWKPVRAAHLGTFYRSPKPGAAPFVELGQTVSAETELCLLEVMKLFTAVRAGLAGIVRQICVPDGELVEGEQVLFYIDTA